MTRLPGHIHLTPADSGRWLGQLAAVLAQIHAAQIDNPPSFQAWVNPTVPDVVNWSLNPTAWRRLVELTSSNPPPYAARLVHGDFQHFNVLWSRERLVGVVDWVGGGLGPPDADIGHAELNGAERKESTKYARDARSWRLRASERDPLGGDCRERSMRKRSVLGELGAFDLLNMAPLEGEGIFLSRSWLGHGAL
jgi:aminoglycoside phosphotransferase (APT) family kinase protein